ILRNEIKRNLELERSAPIHGAAKRVLRRIAGQIARTNTIGAETTNQIGPHLELIKKPQIATAPAGNMTTLEAQHTDNVREHLLVEAGITRGADEFYVAPKSGEILLEFGADALGRV